MQIDGKLLGVRFLETEMGDKDITESLNRIQEAYAAHMMPAWELTKTDPEAGADMVVKRGLSFVLAAGAFHMAMSTGAPKELEAMFAETIGEIVPQMLKQMKAQRSKIVDGDKEPSA